VIIARGPTQASLGCTLPGALMRREYLNAVVDYNIAQFQLWWATSWFSEPPDPATNVRA
jgi:hypothetical protein